MCPSAQLQSTLKEWKTKNDVQQRYPILNLLKNTINVERFQKAQVHMETYPWIPQTFFRKPELVDGSMVLLTRTSLKRTKPLRRQFKVPGIQLGLGITLLDSDFQSKKMTVPYLELILAYFVQKHRFFMTNIILAILVCVRLEKCWFEKLGSKFRKQKATKESWFL